MSPAILWKAAKVSRSRFALALVIVVLSLQGCVFLGTNERVKVIHYPVRRGDTLYQIAKRFHVSVAQIERGNEIQDETALKVGQVLKIPYTGQVTAASKPSVSKSPAKKASQPIGVKPSEVKANQGSLKKIQLSTAAKYVGRLIWPLPAGVGRVSSAFGWRWLSFHEGIDLSGPEGTSIYSSHAGTVVYSGVGIRGYGNLVIVKGESLMTVYGHNRRNLVRRGQTVKAGERIAELGMTGKSTGPHVHYETRIRTSDGKYAAVDPIAFYQRK